MTTAGSIVCGVLSVAALVFIAGCGPGQIGEDSAVLRKGLISGNSFEDLCVTYRVEDGLALFEGDIILGEPGEILSCDNAAMKPYSVIISGSKYRWPEGVIPYAIDADVPASTRQEIADAMTHWESRTHIRFADRQGEHNYVRFVSGSKCSSYVGMRGGAQAITLADFCTTGNTIHEIGHALGLWHEQSRSDRDTYVKINWANIRSSEVNNFKHHISDGDDLGSYDYGSIMHYGKMAFSINGQPTIEPIPEASVPIGQRKGLSQGDVDAVNWIYPDTQRPGCSGCAAGGTCNAACQNFGAEGGSCAFPGSTDPTRCCKCLGDSNGSSTDAIGVLDSTKEGVIRGWACDPDDPTASIEVHIYIGGPAGSGAKGFAVTASEDSEAAVNSRCGGGSAHRFRFKPPYKKEWEGQPVYAYGINIKGGKNAALSGSPRNLPATSPGTPGPGTGPGATPIGVLDTVAGGLVRGWACDTDAPKTSIQVHIYLGGPAGGSWLKVFSTTANRASEAAVNALCKGGAAHRFAYKIPSWSSYAGKPIYAYGINVGQGTNPVLNNCPLTVK